MKLIKLKTDHYVVVDDSEIKEGDWYVHNQKGVGLRVQQCVGTNLPMDSKKITHSTHKLYINDFWAIIELKLSEVKELIGEVDVEKKADEYCSDKWEYAKEENKQSFIDGYNQALEDNKAKKYTEEDMKNALFYALNHSKEDGVISITRDSIVRKSIQSLQPQTEWEVDIINGKLTLKQ